MHKAIRRIVFGIAVVGASVAETAAACQGDGRSGYPAAWWQAADRATAPSWEILPQDAGPCEVILSKRNELGLLSNFAPTPFDLDGVRYASLEGFWQAMKYPEGPNDPRANIPGFTWPHTRAQVMQMTAFEAKAAGDVGSNAMRALGINYVTYQGQRLDYRTVAKGDHYNLIVRATWAKVSQNQNVKDVLLATKDLTLMPDHAQEANASPAWEYFKIWTEIRTTLQRQEQRTH
jgi:hypothetical protein